MEQIDTALEQRVWQRVYGRQPNAQKEPAPLGQLYSTARDCAELCRSLRLESRGPAARRFGQMERQLTQAARRLAAECDGRERIAPPTGCPGCSRGRKLELLRLWLEAWSRRCREYSDDARWGSMLGELAHMGDAHCTMLQRPVSGQR